MERRLLAGGPQRDRGERVLQGLGWTVLTAIILLAWTILSKLYPTLIPAIPSTIDFLCDTGAARILGSVKTTLENSLAGFLIALALALVSASAAHLSRFAEALVEALNTLVQSISVLVWALVLVMIFGVLSRAPPILVTAAACYPLLLSSVLSGFKYLDEKLRELARMLGATKLQELFYFLMPGSTPYILSASRSAVGLALRISVVAEAFGGRGGIGYELMYNYDLGVKEGVFAWALLLVVLMIIIDYAILRPVERWSMKWRL